MPNIVRLTTFKASPFPQPWQFFFVAWYWWILRMSKMFCCRRHIGTFSILMCSTHVKTHFFMNRRMKKENHVAARTHKERIYYSVSFVWCFLCFFVFSALLCSCYYKPANKSTLPSEQYFTILVDKSRLYLHFRHMENKILLYSHIAWGNRLNWIH